MAFPVLAGSLAPVIGQVLRYVFMAHLAGFVIRLFAVLGLALFTSEYLLDPVLDMITGKVGGIPASLAEWLSAFGIDKVISIIASAYTVLSVKRVFLGKSA
jgi:hypothetical protein